MDVATHTNQPWTRHDTFLNSGENSGRFKLYQPVVRQLIERMVLPSKTLKKTKPQVLSFRAVSNTDLQSEKH